MTTESGRGSPATELKACPFCGSTEVKMFPPTCKVSDPYRPDDRLYPIVSCRGCFAEVAGENGDRKGATAIAAWNRREAAVSAQPVAWMVEHNFGIGCENWIPIGVFFDQDEANADAYADDRTDNPHASPARVRPLYAGAAPPLSAPVPTTAEQGVGRTWIGPDLEMHCDRPPPEAPPYDVAGDGGQWYVEPKPATTPEQEIEAFRAHLDEVGRPVRIARFAVVNRARDIAAVVRAMDNGEPSIVRHLIAAVNELERQEAKRKEQT